jgi:hypothetical protein
MYKGVGMAHALAIPPDRTHRDCLYFGTGPVIQVEEVAKHSLFPANCLTKAPFLL